MRLTISTQFSGSKQTLVTMALPFLVLNRYLSTSPAMAAAIKNVTVIGGGLMGSGIAQVRSSVFFQGLGLVGLLLLW